MAELLLRGEVYQVVGAAFEVYNHLGPGFLEAVYQEALQVELGSRGIPFQPNHKLRIRYKEHLLEKYYTPDLLCFDALVVELKAQSRLAGADLAQLLNYLKASSLRVGLLVNFGSPARLDWKRLVS